MDDVLAYQRSMLGMGSQAHWLLGSSGGMLGIPPSGTGGVPEGYAGGVTMQELAALANAQAPRPMLRRAQLNSLATPVQPEHEELYSSGSLLPPGMTLRLAAAGLSTPAQLPFPAAGSLPSTAASITERPMHMANRAHEVNRRQHQQHRLKQQQHQSFELPQSKPSMRHPGRWAGGPVAEEAWREARPEELRPAPGRQTTLRNYLEELRNEDPRRVFVVRRINKLGFRSKALLERHYSDYGPVLKVLVAHSKIKLISNAGMPARTRPGNFGLVLMRNKEDVDRILAEGVEQTVVGVPIQVHRFVQPNLDLEGQDEDREQDEDELTPQGEMSRQTSPQGQADDSAANSVSSFSTGSGEDECRGSGDPSAGTSTQAESSNCLQLESEAHSRQESAGSAESYNSLGNCTGSGGSDIEGTATSQPRFAATASAPGEIGYSAATTPAPQLSSLLVCGEAVARGSHACAAKSSGGAAKTPAGMTPQLAAALGELVRVSQNPDMLTPIELAQATSLATWTQQSLKKLEEECQQKISELSGSPAAQPASQQELLATSQQRLTQLSLKLRQQQQQRSRLQDQQRALQQLHSLNTALGASAIPSLEGIQPAPGLACQWNGNFTACEEGAEGTHSQTAWAGAFASSEEARTYSHAPFTHSRQPHLVAAARHLSACPSSPGVAGATPSARGTLREYLVELRNEDSGCIFTARRINKLGFRSREMLTHHYSKYGQVKRVLVAHSKVRPFRDPTAQLKTRPGGLGLVVMRDADSVRHILALGEEQVVAGHQIRICAFERPEKLWSEMESRDDGEMMYFRPASESNTDSPSGEKGDSTGKPTNSGCYRSVGSSSTRSPEKSEEGGSSEHSKESQNSDSSQGCEKEAALECSQ